MTFNRKLPVSESVAAKIVTKFLGENGAVKISKPEKTNKDPAATSYEYRMTYTKSGLQGSVSLYKNRKSYRLVKVLFSDEILQEAFKDAEYSDASSESD